ncbi:MAG: hypothetical protein Q8P50_13300, partial [Bacillota bacterium]|nr:hypothetical protein [Bacillota bacterium]
RATGSEAAAEKLMHELEGTTPEQVKEQEEGTAELARTLEQRVQEQQRVCGGLKEQLSRMESEKAGSDLRLRLSVWRQQLEVASTEWCVLAIARRFIQETRERYEKERQPAVVQEAQTFFQRITAGRYTRVLAPLGEERLEVEDARAARKDLAKLSRGTAEQLYLALRFGFIREFGRRSVPLPVLLDDILVNFDPPRATAACQALIEVSQSHQVILFTCHPTTVDLLRKHAQNCQVLQLGEST